MWPKLLARVVGPYYANLLCMNGFVEIIVLLGSWLKIVTLLMAWSYA